jgi:uncharacterized caspase-like protein
MTVTTEALELTGTVTDDSRIQTVTLNDKPVKLDPQGTFRSQVSLPAPHNAVTLVAIDVHGHKNTATYTISRADIPQINFGRYHALVIGNNDYAHTEKLITAVPEAEIVADLLRNAYGFNVTLLRNATREEILMTLDRKLRGLLTEKDNLLIYYAGHGMLDEATGRGYWLPVDAHTDHRAYWISNTEITDTLKAFTAKHILVVADSCYSGTLTRESTVSLPPPGQERYRYLAKMVQKRSRTVLTSGGLEPVPDSIGGAHSPFAKALLTVLRENEDIIEGQQLFAKLRPLVVANAPNEPEYANIRYAGHEGGDFFFVRK